MPGLQLNLFLGDEMPPIKRWYPVSHDLNADIEVWELTDRFGVTGLRVWLEILSIADRNEGILPGPWGRYPRLLAARLRSKPRYLVDVCKFVSRWLVDACQCSSSGLVDACQHSTRVRNYAKYNRTRVPNKFPPRPDLTRPDLNPPNPLIKNKGGSDQRIGPQKSEPVKLASVLDMFEELHKRSRK